MFHPLAQVSHNSDKDDPDYGRWAVTMDDNSSSPRDIEISFLDENLLFLNTDLVWKTEPFVMDTEKEANNLLVHYFKIVEEITNNHGE